MAHIRRGASPVPLLVAGVALLAALTLLAVTSNDGPSDKTDILEQVADKPVTRSPVASTASSTTPTTPKKDPSEMTIEERRASRPVLNRSGDERPNEDARVGRPPITFSEPFIDLGILTPGTFRFDTLDVTNTGDIPLTVRSLYTGCDCTKIYFTNGEEVIGPGETVEMTLETDAGWTLATRAVSLSLAFFEYESAAQVTSKFSVNNYVAANPSFANFRSRPEGRIMMTALDSTPYRILSINGAPPIFDDSDDFQPGVDDPRTQYTIRWDFRDVEQPPRLLVVETDHPGSPVFNLPVYSRQYDQIDRKFRKGTMKPERAAYNLEYIAPGETREVRVKVSNLAIDADPRVRFTTVDDISCELTGTDFGAVASEMYLTFTVTLADDFREGSFERPMEVMTEQSTSRIWFFGVCKDGTDQ